MGLIRVAALLLPLIWAACLLTKRRALACAPLMPAQAQVEVGKASVMRQLVPAETLENSATQQYQELLQKAKAQGALADAGNPQLQRLRSNMVVKTMILNRLCTILDCRIEDVMEVSFEDEEKENKAN